MNKRFEQAILEGDLLSLIDSNPTEADVRGIISSSENEWTAFHHAVSLARIDLLSFLMTLTNPSMLRDRYGWTPLHMTAFFNAFSCSEILLENAFLALNARDISGRTPLHIAAQFSDQAQIELFLAKGANASELTNAGKSPLIIAIQYGNLEAVKAIIRYLDHHTLHESRLVMLQAAVNSISLSVVLYLLFESKLYDSIILDALELDSTKDVVSEFLRLYRHCLKNDLEEDSFLDQYLSHWSGDTHCLVAVIYLLSYFNKFEKLFQIWNDLDFSSQCSILPSLIARIWQANSYLTSKKIEVTHKLIEYLPERNEFDIDGNKKSVLMIAAEIDQAKLAQIMLDKEWRVVQRFLVHTDDHENTILHYCAQYNAVNILRIFCDSSSYRKILSRLIDKQNKEGKLALHVALQYNHPDVVEMLAVYLGADLHGLDKKGNTALHIAILLSQPRLASRLVVLGHDVHHVKNPQGVTPYELAIAMRNYSIQSFFNTYALNPRAGLSFNTGSKQISSLVFAGGGVKGIGFVGSVQEAARQNLFHFEQIKRAAGTSAGSIASLLVSLGFSLDDFSRIMRDLDFVELLDERHRETFLTIKRHISNGAYGEIFGHSLYRMLLKVKADGISENYIVKLVTEGIVDKISITGALKSIFGSFFDNEVDRIKQDITDFNKRYGSLLTDIRNHKGLFSGNRLKEQLQKWIFEQTGDANLTFRELAKLIEIYPAKGFKHLYIVAFDLTAHKMQVFSHETTPDAVIADAVRCSISIQVFFTPHCRWEKTLDGRLEKFHEHEYIDGGNILNYPLQLFDRAKYTDSETQKLIRGYDGDLHRINYSTLGFRLSNSTLVNHYENGTALPNSGISGDFISYLLKMLGIFTSMVSQEEEHRSRSENIHRTAYIDTKEVGTVDFDLLPDKKELLIQSGRESVQRYVVRSAKERGVLNDWDVKLAKHRINSEALYRLPPLQQFTYLYHFFDDENFSELDIEHLLQQFDIPTSIRNEAGNTLVHQFAIDQREDLLEKMYRMYPNSRDWKNFDGKYSSALLSNKPVETNIKFSI